MDPRYKLHCKFKHAFVAVHSNLKKELALKRAQEQWNSIKKDKKEVIKWTKLYSYKASDNKGWMATEYVGSNLHA